jgi:SpoIID/LytB domain protein
MEITKPAEREPEITVGIMDHRIEVTGRLDGEFVADGFAPLPGEFSAVIQEGRIVLSDRSGRQSGSSPSIRLIPLKGAIPSASPRTAPQDGRNGCGAEPTFTLFNVTIGNRFHWERQEDQTFLGSLIFQARTDGTLAAINAVSLEDYLVSVIASEMNPAAPKPFLEAHAILSRSWLLAGLDHRKRKGDPPGAPGRTAGEEWIRWYEREEHDLYDVCADDHCQRYQGIVRAAGREAGEAVRKTRGRVLTYHDRICDARYSKACGGRTEEFETAWEDRQVPYLQSLPDGPVHHKPVFTEGDAARWILSEPEAHCNTADQELLKTILPDFDLETKRFFRWRVEYSREELQEILREKSGVDFGRLEEIVPLQRGPSGRISRLKIAGSKKTLVVGKELEIRRWLSRTHLYSSAFIVATTRYRDGQVKRFAFDGAGWGHGVGLCQIGAAVMATRGFSAEQILKHYFRGVEIKKIY